MRPRTGVLGDFVLVFGEVLYVHFVLVAVIMSASGVPDEGRGVPFMRFGMTKENLGDRSHLQQAWLGRNRQQQQLPSLWYSAQFP